MFALACRTSGAHLVAVVDRDDRLVIREKNADSWLDRATLPKDARAIRCSPNGQRIAFVVDRVEGNGGAIDAFELGPEGRCTRLGPVPARALEAFGLAVPNRGPVQVLRDDGTHRHAIVTPSGSAEIHSGCIASSTREHACGEAIRPLDVVDGTLVWRTNTSLFVGHFERPLTDVLDARLSPNGRLFVVRRDQSSGRVEDVLLVGPREGALVEWLRAPVLVKAEWLDERSIAVIRADGDAMTNLLAHAADEYGGEAVAGEAIVVDEHGARPLDGLERDSVRTLHVPR